MKKLFVLLLLIGVCLSNTGCLIAAGYAGAQAVTQRDDTDERMECEKAGAEWVEGNSWVFKDGECIRKENK